MDRRGANVAMMTKKLRRRFRRRGYKTRGKVVKDVRRGQEKKAAVTVDKVPGAQGKMMKNKGNAQGDCSVSEMLWESRWKQFVKSYTGSGRGSERSAALQQRGRLSVWISEKKPHANLEQRIWGLWGPSR